MSSFIDGVNRILRLNGIIRGDDDALTTFTDTTHGATSQLAQISIQNELNDLLSRSLLPYEHTSSTISLVDGTRTYALPDDFIRFFGDPPFLYDSDNNVQIFEYPGGENRLRNQILTYKTDPGTPYWWYLEKTTTKKISFYPVPDASKTLTLDYEKNVNVVNSTDTLPLHNLDEFYAFCDMAGVRFKYMYRSQDIADLSLDPVYKSARSTLFELIRGKNPPGRYGKVYA